MIIFSARRHRQGAKWHAGSYVLAPPRLLVLSNTQLAPSGPSGNCNALAHWQ